MTKVPFTREQFVYMQALSLRHLDSLIVSLGEHLNLSIDEVIKIQQDVTAKDNYTLYTSFEELLAIETRIDEDIRFLDSDNEKST